MGAVATAMPVACAYTSGARQPCRTTARLEELPQELSRSVFLDDKDPWRRWRGVLEADRMELRRVSAAMAEEATALPHGPFVYLVSQLAYRQYVKHGRFIEESDMFADAGGISRPLMAFLQRQYTWSHALCTTASVWDPDRREMVMLRSLDWSSAQVMSFATRVHRFVKGGIDAFISVGITGMTGVLTAMKPGSFAVAINYAEVTGSARPAADPTMLLRQLLENQDVISFGQAAREISRWKPGAPCFISLTGTHEGEGLVIEFGAESHPRSMTDNILVQTNHFEDGGPNGYLNDSTRAAKPERPIVAKNAFCADLIATSRERRREAEQQLRLLRSGASLDEAALAAWSRPPLLNHETVYFAALRPLSRELKVWRSRWES